MTADAHEWKNLALDLSQAGQRAHDKAAQAIGKTAADITADAKSYVPVDTGNLKNSIGYDTFNTGGEMGAEIGPTAGYGMHVEMGTSRMAPQPYLAPAFNRRVTGFEQAMSKLAGEAIFPD